MTCTDHMCSISDAHARHEGRMRYRGLTLNVVKYVHRRSVFTMCFATCDRSQQPVVINSRLRWANFSFRAHRHSLFASVSGSLNLCRSSSMNRGISARLGIGSLIAKTTLAVTQHVANTCPVLRHG